MAIVPLKQTVTRKRKMGELNIWGEPAEIEVTEMKCRAEEGSHTTTDRQSQTQGATVVVDLKLIMDKVADIAYTDELTYVNEAGTVYTGKPKNITIKRDFTGKPLLTWVFV
ncbi:hypothetical protein BK703_16900 [Bacillus thuringiensis serovar silo]|uniref:hypothetical protein n=1 Tax=Bacillus thuringiensis TaxID=1428 RepID=UPI000A35E1D7|nr:hypothetical protein [Bacillus thuringiensis]MDA2128663.1 hypothetical protein [Bacillus cereus]MED3275392.1 hypothetical protein [Bacillus thuringiensis]OTW55317.1 hypothetical protein BK703_16900 [Bacillus thuringiensis serovar silo]OTW74251.1 hypothetical protein BK700_01145 [Bacillus thuringiensis serovar toguchini]